MQAGNADAIVVSSSLFHSLVTVNLPYWCKRGNYFQWQFSLPPANEVCEGYVFRGVCLSTGGHAWQGGCAWQGGMRGGGMHGGGHAWWGACMAGACMVGVCMAGGMHGGGVHGRGHAWQGGVHGKGACVAGGVCMVGACMAGGACHPCPPTDTTGTAYSQWAGSTHPTGMHSCLQWVHSWVHSLQDLQNMLLMAK